MVPVFAEAHGMAGQVEEGLPVLTEALAIVDKTEERWWEAELYRIKAKLLLSLTDENQSEAESCFHQALEVSRRQQAKSLELRAAMSLCRYWRAQGKSTEAEQILTPVYNWFSEGFETLDCARGTLGNTLGVCQTRSGIAPARNYRPLAEGRP